MSKKKLDIPDDLTSKLVGQPIIYSTPSVYQPIAETPATKNLGGRPIKESSVGRVKYTTALSKDLIKFLRVEAAQREITPADLLDIIITEFKNKI